MYSKTVAVGRLTKDPIFRAYGNQGDEMALFTMAISEGKDKTSFYDCIAFQRTAKLMKDYLSNGKGRLILAEGRFQNNDTERDINGTKVKNYGMNFVVNHINFLDSNPQGQGQQQQQQRQQQPAPQQNQQYGQQQQQQQQQQGGFYNQAPPAQQQQQQPVTDPFQSNSFSGFIEDDDLPFN